MEYSLTKQELDENAVKARSRIAEYRDKNLGEPDVYFLNDLMMDVALVGVNGRAFEKNPYDYLYDKKYRALRRDFYDLMAEEMPKLIDSEIGLDAQELYDYFEVSLKNVGTLSSLGVTVEGTREFLNILCDEFLYTKKKIRDYNGLNSVTENDDMVIGGVVFDNDAQLYQILTGFQEYLGIIPQIATFSVSSEPVKVTTNFNTVGKKVLDMVGYVNGIYGKKYSEVCVIQDNTSAVMTKNKSN